MTQAASPHRSYSQVRQLRTCGWQYFLERVQRVAARPSVPAIAGVAVHVATEVVDKLLHNGQADPTLLIGKAQEAADASVDEAITYETAAGWEPHTWKFFGKQDIAWFRTTGIPSSITAYVAWRLANPDWVLAEVPNFGPAIEVPFNYFATPGRPVRGFIDRIFTSRSQGGYYVFDIKSGLKPKNDEQLGIYAQALREGLGWTVTHGYYIYGLKTGEAKLTQPIDVSHWTQAKVGLVYERASAVIDQGIFIPNPGDACFTCSVSANCEYAVSSAV